MFIVVSYVTHDTESYFTYNLHLLSRLFDTFSVLGLLKLVSAESETNGSTCIYNTVGILD